MLQAKLSPSMMCAKIEELPETLRIFENAGIPYLHMDVMDGHFVQNMMLGTDFIKQVRRMTTIPLDIHVMAEEPERILSWFDPQPGEYVSIHAESTRHLQRTLQSIRDCGAKPMAAINPATPLSAIEEVLCDVDAVLIMTVNPGFAGQALVPQTLDKVSRLRTMLDASGRAHIEIEVDGNVSLPNAEKMRAAGANMFVAGTSCLFKPGDLSEHIRTFYQTVAEK